MKIGRAILLGRKRRTKIQMALLGKYKQSKEESNAQ